MAFELPTQKKLNIIRHYPLEVLVYILLGAVGFLGIWQYRTTGQVNDLQKEMKMYLYSDRETLIKAIDKNTETNEKTNEINKSLADALKELKPGH